MRLLSLCTLVALALGPGCHLRDDPGRHRCLTDENCSSGHVCLNGQCLTSRPPGLDAGLSDAVDDARPDAGLTADLALPEAGAADTSEAPARCGNFQREGREECDDGNQADDDFCTSGCQWTRPPQLSAGRHHTCLRTGDQRVRCWGANGGLELSGLPATARAVASADQGACYIRDDGTIGCPIEVGTWGDRTFFAPTGTYSALSIRGQRACAIRTPAGTLECWGPSYPDGPTPPGRYLGVSLGPSHACALAEGGAVVCWGRNESGESSPPTGKFTRVSVGAARTCALRESGELVCWGSITLTAA